MEKHTVCDDPEIVGQRESTFRQPESRGFEVEGG